MTNALVWMRRRVREAWTDQLELQERMSLANRPWAEHYLHWARTADGWELHGHLLPPRGWRRFSVTRGGWCLGQLIARDRHPERD
ncbi:MAG TPA: hypothetical protein VG317_18370 [Pseudonocardiaceae bacterium]|nr:hypothetical protein [Pseudonocardiaceae bacterium]